MGEKGPVTEMTVCADRGSAPKPKLGMKGAASWASADQPDDGRDIPRMPFVARKLGVPLVICAAMALTALAPSVASAQRVTRCPKTLIHDWYVDGHIQGQYRVSCYRAALAEVPSDMVIYGSVRRDLSQALSSGITRVRQQGVTAKPQTLLPAPERVALSAPSSRSDSHPVVVFAAFVSLALLLAGWLVLRLRTFRSSR
jgi:hypothetical protein